MVEITFSAKNLEGLKKEVASFFGSNFKYLEQDEPPKNLKEKMRRHREESAKDKPVRKTKTTKKKEKSHLQQTAHEHEVKLPGKPMSSPPTKDEFDMDQVRKSLQLVIQNPKLKMAKAREILAEFGAEKMGDLSHNDYGPVIGLCQKYLAESEV